MENNNKAEETAQVYKKSETTDLLGIVKMKDGKIRIVMGKYIADEKEFQTFEEAEKYIAEKPYELIYNLILITINYAKEIKN